VITPTPSSGADDVTFSAACDDLVYVEVTAAGVRLGAADDCSALDVRAADDVLPSLDEQLRRSQLGSWDGGAEAALNAAELRARAAAGDVAADWAQRWAAMIAYAGRSGWLSDDGTIVRAHIAGPAD
jgi:hypothetical protein